MATVALRVQFGVTLKDGRRGWVDADVTSWGRSYETEYEVVKVHRWHVDEEGGEPWQDSSTLPDCEDMTEAASIAYCEAKPDEDPEWMGWADYHWEQVKDRRVRGED